MINAIRVHQTGGPEVLKYEQVPIGEPGPGEAKVRHEAVGLNFIDVYFRTGLYKAAAMPFTPGNEGAGTVVAVGAGVENVHVGDRVAYVATPGSYADERILPADRLVKVPAGVDLRTAAAMMLKGMTAQYLLRRTFRVERGQTILFHAAAGGVGLIAGQWAKHLGATVIGTAGSAEKIALAKAHGYDHVINYREERFEGVVRKLTRKRGVDVVFEHVGVDTWAGSMFSLRRGGTLVTCGSTTGISTEINLFQLYQQQLRLIGSFGCRMENIAHALAKIAGGVVSPVIDSVATLDDLDDALQRIESRQVFGKIIVML